MACMTSRASPPRTALNLTRLTESVSCWGPQPVHMVQPAAWEGALWMGHCFGRQTTEAGAGPGSAQQQCLSLALREQLRQGGQETDD